MAGVTLIQPSQALLLKDVAGKWLAILVLFGLTPYGDMEFIEDSELPIESVMIGPCRVPQSESRTLILHHQVKKYKRLIESINS